MKYRFKAILVTTLVRFSFFFFVVIEKVIQKLIWKRKGTKITKTILKKKNNVGGMNLPHFENYVTRLCDIGGGIDS